MKQIVVLASGRGSNFQAIVSAIQEDNIRAQCIALISDNPLAVAVDIARDANIPAHVLDFLSFPDKSAYEEALLYLLVQLNPDIIALAGYMRLLGDSIIQTFPDSIINIHPSLLPSFPGLHAQEQALRYGVKIAGCTVHFVTKDMDNGPVIMQRSVPVLDDDDKEHLADRILVEEHKALPEVLRLICEDRIRREGRKVTVLKNPSGFP
ncbi:MAG: phosphoribosylglycinamide formyltransferase [Methanospirillaceae archaeon]|nr:phosphoribosylglycinamide formyltransferase [Methanospirillaceae archaeon]